MKKLDEFVSKIDGFYDFDVKDQIGYFAYYILYILNEDGFLPSEIKACFNELYLSPYSNISSYLIANSRGRVCKFIKKNGRYFIERRYRETLQTSIKVKVKVVVSKEFVSSELVTNTRGYIEKNLYQINMCYEVGLYDSCLVMIRKLIETLIIETFEKYSLESLIKGKDGHFLFLGELLPIFINEKKWNLSRNAKESLPSIKKYGDLSAHNRRFTAAKHDLDNIREDLRIIIEEIVGLIDYK